MAESTTNGHQIVHHVLSPVPDSQLLGTFLELVTWGITHAQLLIVLEVEEVIVHI